MLHDLNVGLFNTRSLCNKTAGVFELLSDANISICLLTETWLRKGDTSKIAEIKDLGYNIAHQSRAGRGGGVAIAYKKHLKFTRRNIKAYKSFEHIECVIKSPSGELLRFCCVYRSCTAKLSNVPDFCKDFDDYLDSLVQLPGKVIIAGDFNIHVEDPTNPDTRKFMQILTNYGLIQHVSSSTHISGGILDLVITRKNSCDYLDIKNIEIIDTTTSSDHSLITFSCSFAHQNKSAKVHMTGRKIGDIDIQKFKEDLLLSDLSVTEKFIDCNTATELYNRELSRILDVHAPEIEFSVNPDQSKWVNTDCQIARRKRRKAERDDNRLQSEESRSAYKKASKHAEAVINTTRNAYYSGRLKSSEGNKKDTYKIVNQIMDRDLTRSMIPNHKSDDVICEDMKDFFVQKVEKICSDLSDINMTNDSYQDMCPDFQGEPWSKFTPVDEVEFREIISDLNKKECEEDPIPLKLLLQCIDEIKPIMMFIVNDSLSTGVFPSILKNALVRPVIKDENGDVNSYKNYRPISNLPFLSKVIEKCVQRQLERHLKFFNLHAEHQSGYRSNHSCETATLTIYNDLLCLSDVRNKVVLLLLDLSAAFDTVNHPILLSKLRAKYGFSGDILNWFKSYLSDRSFTVTINKSRSRKCYLRIGVPQGSILGPILFILYTKELNLIAESHGFSIHLYADDTQLYIEFNPLYQDMSLIETKIVECLEEIKHWMTSNNLKLNPDKTEALVAQTRNNLSTWSVDSLQLSTSGETIEPSTVVKSLGVLFDEYLTFEGHVNSVIQCCNIHLRNLRVIGSKLNFDLKKQLIHCLIFSKLDYCNGLLYGLPECTIKKLQKVQNSCVRFLFGRRTFRNWESVTPLLKKAHFLPIRQRIDYKIALTVFKCINNIAPGYITKCIKVKNQPLHTLRTDKDYFLLTVPPVSNFKRTERSFSFCGPSVWNCLPYELRTLTDVKVFKNRLKTHLFKEVFHDI